MSFDRIDPYSAGYGKPGPQRPSKPPPIMGASARPEQPNNLTDGLALPAAAAVSHSFTKDWAKKTAYGSQGLAAELLNKATAPDTPLGKKLSSSKKTPANELGVTATEKNLVSAAEKSATYADALHLGTEQIPIRQVSIERLRNTVNGNLSEFKAALKPGNASAFFGETTAKSFMRDTVVKSNLRPVHQLMTNHPDKQIGTGIFRTAAIGLMGYDVVKHTYDAYQDGKSKENGSFNSKVNTYYQTAKAFGKYVFRDGVSWEMAGVGATLAKALIPIAIGGISIPAILVGAAVGVGVEKGLDHILDTGDKDPIEQKKHAEKERLKAEKEQHLNSGPNKITTA